MICIVSMVSKDSMVTMARLLCCFHGSMVSCFHGVHGFYGFHSFYVWFMVSMASMVSMCLVVLTV